jgi:hypothetical protein
MLIALMLATVVKRVVRLASWRERIMVNGYDTVLAQALSKGRTGSCSIGTVQGVLYREMNKKPEEPGQAEGYNRG